MSGISIVNIRTWMETIELVDLRDKNLVKIYGYEIDK